MSKFFLTHMRAYEKAVKELQHFIKPELQEMAKQYIVSSAIPELTKNQLIHEIADGMAMDIAMAEHD